MILRRLLDRDMKHESRSRRNLARFELLQWKRGSESEGRVQRLLRGTASQNLCLRLLLGWKTIWVCHSKITLQVFKRKVISNKNLHLIYKSKHFSEIHACTAEGPAGILDKTCSFSTSWTRVFLLSAVLMWGLVYVLYKDTKPCAISSTAIKMQDTTY